MSQAGKFLFCGSPSYFARFIYATCQDMLPKSDAGGRLGGTLANTQAQSQLIFLGSFRHNILITKQLNFECRIQIVETCFIVKVNQEKL